MAALTPTTEDYLQAIDALRDETGDVRAARLAERMAVSAASVSQTLERMKDQELVEVAADHRIHLTGGGREAADSINRRHRLTERFLVDVLDLDWVSAHEEAHRIEHAISDKVEARLSALLNHPQTCPHGAPIPGNFPEDGDSAWRRLSSFQSDERGEIARISEAIEDDTALLQFCDDKNIRPQTRFRVVEVGPDGVYTLETESGAVAISDRMTGHIFCVAI